LYIIAQIVHTKFLKKKEIKKNWILLDAENAVLGRLAVIASNVLRGKNKVDYTPNQDCGDYLIIINANKVKLTGKKMKDKVYYKHTGYPGGLKKDNPENMIKKGKSSKIIQLAIKRMIPTGPLGYKQLTNCKIYPDNNHPHNAQNPKIIDIKEINKKNISI